MVSDDNELGEKKKKRKLTNLTCAASPAVAVAVVAAVAAAAAAAGDEEKTNKWQMEVQTAEQSYSSAEPWYKSEHLDQRK